MDIQTLLTNAQQSPLGAMPRIAPVQSWGIRYQAGVRHLTFDMPVRIPLQVANQGVMMTDATVTIAITEGEEGFEFHLLSPEPASVMLPNWRRDGLFVSDRAGELLQRDRHTPIEQVMEQFILPSLLLHNDADLLREAVNLDAVAWLHAHDAFQTPAAPVAPVSPAAPVSSAAPSRPIASGDDGVITMHHRPRPQQTPAPIAPQPPMAQSSAPNNADHEQAMPPAATTHVFRILSTSQPAPAARRSNLRLQILPDDEPAVAPPPSNDSDNAAPPALDFLPPADPVE